MSWLQVLVACSHVERRIELVENLARCGLEAMIAADVNEVRAVFAQGPVHLVFCEDGLPEGGFREVLRFAKTTGSGVPLVVCSLLGELDEYLEAMQLGGFDFIAPPIVVLKSKLSSTACGICRNLWEEFVPTFKQERCIGTVRLSPESWGKRPPACWIETQSDPFSSRGEFLSANAKGRRLYVGQMRQSLCNIKGVRSAGKAPGIKGQTNCGCQVRHH